MTDDQGRNPKFLKRKWGQVKAGKLAAKGKNKRKR